MVRFKAGTQAHDVLKILRKHKNGLTREQIMAISGLTVNAACGRIGILLDYSLVYAEGSRRAESGVDVDVYHISKAGRRHLDRN